MSPCPSDADLRALLQNQLPSAQQRELDAHVAGCARCGERLGRLVDEAAPLNSSLLQAVRSPADSLPSFLRRAQDQPPPREPRTPAPTAMPTPAGYDVLEELGRGGMGVVYRARHVALDRVVALKMILPESRTSEEDLARFRREALVVARMRHPSIVQVYEVGEHDGLPYFSLEFVEGGSLADRLDGTPLPARCAAELLEPIARAMHHAHRQGIIHRDLKPANVLLAVPSSEFQVPRDEGTAPAALRTHNLELTTTTPKVSDFGLARRVNERVGPTQAGAIVGTPPYMAPEQVNGRAEDLGPGVDIYGLGAVLYELLTGRPPFRAETVLDTLLQVVSQEPVPPGRLNPRVPRDLETICLKCLEKSATRRYPSAEALADDLRCYLDGRPTRARPPSSAERALKWARRKPASAALVAFVALAIGLAIAGGIMHTRRLQEQIDQKVEALGQAEAQKGIAQRESVEAKIARDAARESAKRAVSAAEEARDHLVRLTLGQGHAALDEGDLLGALPFYADALVRDAHGGEAEARHRLRLALTLAQAPRLRQVFLHRGAITSVMFSPDGGRLLTTSLDGTARAWDADTGQPIGEAMAHGGPVNHAAFSPDGKRIATGGDDRTARLWDAATGRPLGAALSTPAPVVRVVFRPPEGTQLLVASGSRFERTLHTSHTTPPTVLPGTTQYIPGPPIMIPGPNGRMVPGPPRMIPVPGAPRTVPGTTIPRQEQPRGALQLWDGVAAKEMERLVVPGWMSDVVFRPDGAEALAGAGTEEGRNAAWLWPLQGGRDAAKTLPHEAHVQAVAFSPDGRRLLTAAGRPEANQGEAIVWDAATGQRRERPLRHGGPVVQVGFSPNGRRAVTASHDETARVWDAETGEPVSPPLRHRDRLVGAWFSPDGRRVLTAGRDGVARLWHASTGEPLSPLLRHSAPLTCAAFAPDGRRVVTAAQDGTVKLWDLASRADGATVLPHGDVVPAPPAGNAVASFWDRPGRGHVNRTRRHLGGIAVTGVTVAEGPRLITAAGPRVLVTQSGGGGSARSFVEYEPTHLCIWDVETPRPPFLVPHAGTALRPALRPDGRQLLVVVPNEAGQGAKVQLVDISEGKTLQERALGPGVVPVALAFDRQGRGRVAAVRPVKAPAGGATTELVVQMVDNADEGAILPLDGRPTLAAFSPEGSHLAAVLAPLAAPRRNEPLPPPRLAVWPLGPIAPQGTIVAMSAAVTHLVVGPAAERIVVFHSDQAPLTLLPAGPVERDGEGALLIVPATGQVVRLPHAEPVTFAEFSEDGQQVVTTSLDKTARVWSTADGSARTPPLHHRARVNHASFGPKGLLATASHDGTARVWHASTGEPIGAPLVHGDIVLAVGFRGDARTIVTTGADGTARLWDGRPESRLEEDLRRLAHLLAGRRLDATRGLTPLEPGELREVLPALRAARADDFTPSPEEQAGWRRRPLKE